MKTILLLVAVICVFNVQAQERVRKSPHDTVSNANVTVTYGRPYKKERDIFGGLEKYGKVWRVGADEASTITFNKNVVFGDKTVPAGTYTLFAIPNEKEWTIILNSQLGQWGAFSYDKNKDKDVAQITVPSVHVDKPVEQLTIRFPTSSSMVIEWDRTMVTVPMKF